MSMRVEQIAFHGVAFRRYPDAKAWADRAYFTPGSADRARGIGRLHEEIWKAEHGPIPDGHHIHHADLNALNNNPSNLVCLPASEHQAIHATDPARLAYLTSPEHLAHLDSIRDLAAQWHSSPEGRAWHVAHGHASWNRAPSTATCEQCGAHYESKLPDKFCSNACKSAHRRASGADDVTRSCERCGVPFNVNKHKRTRFCSRSCASLTRAERARLNT